MLPNFLIIGAAKSGTTAIWSFLRKHPDIYMSQHKEPRFFALYGYPIDFCGPGDKTNFRFVTKLDAYEQLFEGVKGERAIGEASTWYLYVPTAAPAIKRFIPDVRLIAILRDPVERAFSNYLHARSEGLEPLPTFREAMHAEADRIQHSWSPRFHYKQKGFYYKQISHYLNFFTKDKIKIYLYEDFVNDHNTMFSDLFSYLEVDPMQVDARERINEARLHRSKALNSIIKNGHPVMQALKPFLPPNLRRRLKSVANDLNRIKPRLSKSDREEFVALYRDDILRLSQLLGRDLSNWLEVRVDK